MSPPPSHGENRKKVCGPCGRKIVYGKIKPEKFLISQSLENLIKKFISKDFDLNDEKYPSSICRSCYLALLDFEKEIFNRQLPNMPNYGELILGKEPLPNDSVCYCYICSTAKFKGHTKVEKSRGKFRDINEEIDISSSFQEQKKKSEQHLLEKSSDFIDSLTLCMKCFQEIGKGKIHSCKNIKEFAVKIVEKLPGKVQQQIVTRSIKITLKRILISVENVGILI